MYNDEVWRASLPLRVLLLGGLWHVHVEDVVAQKHFVPRLRQNLGYFLHVLDLPHVQISCISPMIQGLFFEA
jgi:hypothetical protein